MRGVWMKRELIEVGRRRRTELHTTIINTSHTIFLSHKIIFKKN